MKITLYTWTTDDQNGMNTQILTNKRALKAAMLDTIGRIDADRADLMRLASFGGLEWERHLEEWREEQMADQNYYSWGEQEVEIVMLHEVGFWPAVVPALARLLDCPDLNLVNLEAESVAAIEQARAALAVQIKHDTDVMRVPVVSSQHVTKEDGARLVAADSRDVLATIYDQTGHIVHWGDDETIEDAFPADRFSDAFRALVAHFHAQGYTYLRIDAHGEVVEGLPVFDW